MLCTPVCLSRFDHQGYYLTGCFTRVQYYLVPDFLTRSVWRGLLRTPVLCRHGLLYLQYLTRCVTYISIYGLLCHGFLHQEYYLTRCISHIISTHISLMSWRFSSSGISDKVRYTHYYLFFVTVCFIRSIIWPGVSRTSLAFCRGSLHQEYLTRCVTHVKTLSRLSVHAHLQASTTEWRPALGRFQSHGGRSAD